MRIKLVLFIALFLGFTAYAQTVNSLDCYTSTISSCNAGFSPVLFISGQDNAHASETADAGYVPVCCQNTAGTLSVSANPTCAAIANHVFAGLYSVDSSTPAANSHGQFNSEADGSYDWGNSANANRQLCLDAGAQPMTCWRTATPCNLSSSACVLAIGSVANGESGHVAACETYSAPGAYDYICCSTQPSIPTQPGIQLVIESLSLIQQPDVEVSLNSPPSISLSQSPIVGIKARIKNLGSDNCPNAKLRFWFETDDGQTVLPTAASSADYYETAAATPIQIAGGASTTITELDNRASSDPEYFFPVGDLTNNSQNLDSDVYLLSVDAYCDTVRHNSKRAFFSVFNTYSISVPELPFWLGLLAALAFAGVLTAKSRK